MSESWLVVVARAWVEADGLRVRLLRTDAGPRVQTAVVASAAEASERLRQWLAEFEDEGRGEDAGPDASD